MKRFFTLVLALLLLVTPLLSCGDGCGEGDGGTTPQATEPPVQPPQVPDPIVDNNNYRAEAEAYFAAISTSRESDFVYDFDTNGKARILSYKGGATSVRIPETVGIGLPVRSIADGAFANNTALKALVIPNSVETIGKGILEGCTAIEAISAPFFAANATEAQYAGYLFGLESYRDHTKIPASLAYVRVSGAAAVLSDYAFSECQQIRTVLLSDMVKKVGKFAFYDCESLKYVDMDHLTEIGNYAFASCRVLVRATMSREMLSIGLGAFQGCGALSEMTLPFVGGSKESNAFLGYLFGASTHEFTAGFLPAYLRRVTVLEGCTSLSDYAFFECSSLREVKLPATLTTVGVRAFEKCTALESIVLPDAVRTVRENAFFGCSSLASLQLGNGLQILGANVFYGCSALKSVTLPASLGFLPASAFADCRALESIDLGGVTRIGKNAFHNCSALSTVHAHGEVELEDGNDRVKEILEK